MKTVAKKMKNYSMGVNIVNNNNLQNRILNFLLIFFGILALFYVLILSNMVFNIVERKSFDANALVLLNEVGDLELQYLIESDKIDLELAKSLGFNEVKTKFATRRSLGYRPTGEAFGSVNINSNEL